MQHFIRELRRREVFRTAGFYLIGAWILLQLGDVIAEPLGIPNWVLRLLLYAVIVGFPISLVLGWRYDITANGITRTPPLENNENLNLSLRPLDYGIFLVLTGVAVAVLFQLATPDEEAPAVAVTEAPAVQQTAAPNSIAVMPFADLSPDQSKHYLADGVADTVMHVLSQVDGVTVTSRTSAFAYRGKPMRASEIGKELNVAHILEGSVQAVGEDLRIIARLINVQDDNEIWSANFREKVSDIFAIQDEIASEVAAALEVTVLNPDEIVDDDRYRPALAAFEKLILGRAAIEKATRDGFLEARQLFKDATEIDPNYAEAWVALADTYRISSFTRDISPPESVAIRRPLLEKALDLDPLSAAAHTAMGYVLRVERDLEASTRSFRRAIELNPNHAPAHAGLGSNLFRAGQFDESLDSHQRAVALDPKDNQYRIFLANAYWTLAQSERALGMIRDNIENNPEITSNYMMMNQWLVQLGRAGEALEYALMARSKDPRNPRAQMMVCDGYQLLLMIEEATQCAAQYLEDNPNDFMGQLNTLFDEKKFAEALANLEPIIAASPGQRFLKELRVSLLFELERWPDVIEAAREVYPELASTPPEVTKWNIWMSTMVVHSLAQLERDAEAETLADAGLDFLSRQRRLQAGAHVLGAEDAGYYASLGQREKMLERLDAAIDDGWLRLAFQTLESPIYDAWRDDDGFRARVEKLENRINAQREAFLANYPTGVN